MKEKIIWIIAREHNIPPTDLGPATRFDMLEMDSLDFLCLLQVISEELFEGKRLSNSEITKIETVGDAVAAFERAA